jgi:hypothetical protein
MALNQTLEMHAGSHGTSSSYGSCESTEASSRAGVDGGDQQEDLPQSPEAGVGVAANGGARRDDETNHCAESVTENQCKDATAAIR